MSHLGFGNDAQVLWSTQTAQEILDTAEDVAAYVTNAGILPLVLSCSTFTPDRSLCHDVCARHRTSAVPSITKRWRARRVPGALRQRQGQGRLSSAIKWTLVAMIQSPSAIYRSELGTAEGDGYTLSQHELASELAYTFSGTTPTVALLDKADRGELASPAVLLSEAQALIATPRGQSRAAAVPILVSL